MTEIVSNILVVISLLVATSLLIMIVIGCTWLMVLGKECIKSLTRKENEQRETN